MYFDASNKPMTATLQAIPDGKAGTVATLKIMRDVTKAGKTSLVIRNLALSLISGLSQKDWFNELKVLHAFVRDQIRYVKDIRGVETVQTPEVTLSLRAGDCDDKSVLLAALLESIGHPTAFVAIGFKPDDFVHVFVESRIGTKWIPLETTEPVNVGWYPKGVVSRLVVYN
jgi:transglutaminase-like putative cysteine protease